MARPIGDQGQVVARVQVLRQRFERWRSLMERLDLWRYMDKDGLKTEIWGSNIPENSDRWTIIKPDIAATTETVISFTTSRRPRITATARNTISAAAQDSANQVERLGYAIYDTVERYRDTPLIRETFDYAFHRGAMVSKVLRLSPEERGAVTEELAPVEYDDPELNTGEEPVEVVVAEERFPVLVKPVDPYECAWMTAPDGRLLEFVHEYDDSADSVVATFPEIESMKEFSNLTGPSGGNQIVKVTDYWTEEEHCILIDGRFFKKPTKHEYPGIPIVVDLAAPRTKRNNDRGQFAREGTPFCANMLDAVAMLSKYESWMTASLEEVAFPLLTLEGVDPDDSPHMQRGSSGESEFTIDVQLGPTKNVHPAFRTKSGAQERFKYLEPPPVAPALQQAAAARLRDASMVAFPETIISGQITPDPSGYAYSQMKHGAYSKTAPYFLAGDRHLSRVLEQVNKLLVHDWDRHPDMPLQLVTLIGQQNQQEQTLEVTKEMLAAIGNIKVEIQPDMPIDLEKEWSMYFQANAQGLMSTRTVMDKMGQVEDPTIEYENIIFEQFAREDPNTVMAIVAKVLQRNGYQTPQQRAPQAQPQSAPASPQMPGMPAPGAMPPGQPGMAPQLPPEAMAAMMGGGDPAMMGGDPMAAMMGGGGAPMSPEEEALMMQGMM